MEVVFVVIASVIRDGPAIMGMQVLRVTAQQMRRRALPRGVG